MGLFVDLTKDVSADPYQAAINAKYAWMAPLQGDGRLKVFEVVRQPFWDVVTIPITAAVQVIELFTDATRANAGSNGYYIEPGKLPSPMTAVIEGIRIQLRGNAAGADAADLFAKTTYEVVIGSNNKRSIFAPTNHFAAGAGIYMPSSTADTFAQNGVPSYDAEKPIDPALIIQSAEAYRGRLTIDTALVNAAALVVEVKHDQLVARAV